MQVQRQERSGLVYGTLYDLDQPVGKQIVLIGPIDTVADILLGLVEKPEISLTYENLN